MTRALAAAASLLLLFTTVRAGQTATVLPPAPKAVQTVHRDGVPHTDRKGKRLLHYDPERSFLPIGTWGNSRPGQVQGQNYDWALLKQAGFNTVWPWPYDREQQLRDAVVHGLQVIFMSRPGEETLRKLKDHPNLLGVVWQDEPIIQPGTTEQTFLEFLEYRRMAERVAPDLLVFVNETAWITHPDWLRWNTAGNIACHDNYPNWPVTNSINRGSFGTATNGIPQTVSLSVAANPGKPAWLIVGAFEVIGSARAQFPFRFPTPTQLRAEVYAGLIHGATGICYFTWDSWISRDGEVIGFSPNPKADIRAGGLPRVAKPMQLVNSHALWDAISRINAELNELTPVLFAPTVGEDELGYTAHYEGNALTEFPIRALLKPHPEGGYVLLTVNLDRAVLDGVFKFAKPLGGVMPLFETGEVLPIEEGAREFSAEYEPFGTRVFRLALMR